MRDYIHVMDLAEGHLAALDYAKARGPQGGNFVFNLGTDGVIGWSRFSLCGCVCLVGGLGGD